MRIISVFAAVVVVAVFAFAIFEPVQVLPRVRLAPGFSLVDQSGASYTSADAVGDVTLYTFVPADCGAECDAITDTVTQVAENLESEIFGEGELRFVSLVLDSEDPDVLAAAAAAVGADGDRWRFVGGPADEMRTVVGSGFRVFYEPAPAVTTFDPTFVIVDGTGLIRGEYRYASLVPEADRLSRHLELLATEIRESDGASSILYEAAHVFLCYP